jgi:hypothetical protein
MAHYKTAFPSKYLSAAEIATPFEATIENVDFDDVGTSENPERKLVCSFEEEHKPIVLNLTRCEAIAEIAKTEDYERWSGTRVRISQGVTRYAGKRVPCIVVSAPDLPF